MIRSSQQLIKLLTFLACPLRDLLTSCLELWAGPGLLLRRFTKLPYFLALYAQGKLGIKLQQGSMVCRIMLSSPANNVAGATLTQQPSSFAVRFEEIQNSKNESGKNLESMNIDEFMKNIWMADESKTGVGTLVSSAAESSGFNRQDSLSLPPPLCNKTVEDVWGDIQRQSAADLPKKQQQQQQQPQHEQQQKQHHQNPHLRPAPLGEMTLEDFLVRTGVVREDPGTGPNTDESNKLYPTVSTASVSNGFSSTMDAMVSGIQPDWMNYPAHPHQHQQLLQQAEAVAAAKRGFQPPSLLHPAGSSMYDGVADSAVLGPDSFANSLTLSPAFSDYSMQSRKRFTSEVAVEKTMERRQKRMIKNRESAARSRARKQAYTVELEAEVTLLKEENARLKKQQVLLSRLPEATCLQNTKTRVLRRTQSC
eukprot:c9594_g1_i1 orf=205-1473(+)